MIRFTSVLVAGLTGNRPVQDSSTCQSGSQFRVLSIWGLGSGFVSQVPCLGDAIGVVGEFKKRSALIKPKLLKKLSAPEKN